MDCPKLIHTRYGVFSERLHETIIKRHIPASGSIELTTRCNLNCAHCYINQPVSHAGVKKRELTESQWISMIDQMADEGCLWLLMTGGEPFVRKDFFHIYTHAKKKGMLISLFTNGTQLTERIADYLTEWTPFVVEITLYGRTQETYERVTGVPGSHKRCYQAIDMLMKRQIPLQLKSMVLNINQSEVRSMQQFSRDRGLTFRYDPVISKRIDGSDMQRDCRLSPQEIVAFENEDEERRSAWLDIWKRLSHMRAPEDRLFTCGAGRTSFHIDASGVLYICIMVRHHGYDLKRGSFHEGWHHFIPGILEQKRVKSIPCATCDIQALCDYCSGWVKMETGDIEGYSPYLCEIAHLRADRMGIQNNLQTIQRQMIKSNAAITKEEKHEIGQAALCRTSD
ncbi:radical SAM protein [bacterium]|nr:radical SAM protein [bacterium]